MYSETEVIIPIAIELSNSWCYSAQICTKGKWVAKGFLDEPQYHVKPTFLHLHKLYASDTIFLSSTGSELLCEALGTGGQPRDPLFAKTN